jgi:hypothetical protein
MIGFRCPASLRRGWFFAAVSLASVARAQTVTVDTTTRFQVIDGFVES